MTLLGFSTSIEDQEFFCLDDICERNFILLLFLTPFSPPPLFIPTPHFALPLLFLPAPLSPPPLLLPTANFSLPIPPFLLLIHLFSASLSLIYIVLSFRQTNLPRSTSASGPQNTDSSSASTSLVPKELVSLIDSPSSVAVIAASAEIKSRALKKERGHGNKIA